MPKASTVLAIAKALGVPMQQILKQPTKAQAEDLADSMLAVYMALDERDQRAVLVAAKALLERK